MATNYGCSTPFEGNYTLSGSGDAQARADYSVKSIVPGYASMFYSLTEHELLSEIKYDKTTADYDRQNKAIIESIRGPPLDLYIPNLASIPDFGSASPKTGQAQESKKTNLIEIPDKDIIAEIINSQKEVTGKEIVLQDIELEEMMVKRKIRLRVLKSKPNKKEYK